MSITLNSNWQLINEKNMGSFGYGTLYLQLYAKLDNQNIANNQSTYTLYARVNCVGSYCSSGNCYATIDGTAVKDNVSLTFPTNGYVDLGTKQIIVTHDANGNKSDTKSATFRCYALGLNNTFTATGTFNLPKIARYATCNQSLGSKTETTIKISWSSNNIIDYIWYSTNNGSSWTGIDVTDGTSGTYTISGLSANTTYNIKTRIRRKDNQLTTDSSLLEVTTYQYPYVKSVNVDNLIIGNEQTVNLYNPLNREVTVCMYQKDTGVKLYQGTTTSSSTFKFTPTKSTLYNSIPNSDKGICYYYCIYSGIISSYITEKKYTIKREECIPIFTSFTAKDINQNTVSLTGNNQAVIKGYSNIQINISASNKAVGKNGASIVKYVAVAGSKVININYSSTQDVTGIINSTTSPDVAIYAIDSRGIGSKVVTKSFIFKEYFKPVIKNIELYRDNGIGKKALFKIEGNVWNGNFGAKQNSIHQVNFHYKKKNETNYSELINVTNQIISSNGRYKNNDGAFLTTTSSGSTNIEFEVGIEYDIQFFVSDQAVLLVYTTSGVFKLNNGIPCTSKQKNSDGKYSMGINCLPDSNYALKIDGYLSAKTLKGNLNFYEYTTLDVKSSSQYPKLVEKTITTYGGDLFINIIASTCNISTQCWLRGYIEIDGINKGFVFDTTTNLKISKTGFLIAKDIAAGTHTIVLKIYNNNGAIEILTKPAFTGLGLTVIEL